MVVDVIVVGCGPVGTMAALRCTQRGLKVLAIDKSTEIYPLPRAIGMDEEIQRLFQNAGLESELTEVSTPLYGAEFVNADRERLVGLELPEGFCGTSGHPMMTMFDQPAVETFLRAKASAAGVEMRLGVEAVEISDTGDQVTATIAGSDGTEEQVSSRWLIGADGGSSTVRKLIGVELDDQGFDEEWLVVDTTLVGHHPDLPTIAQQVCDPKRVVSFVPGHDRRRRWEFQVNQGESGSELAEEAALSELLADWVEPGGLTVDRKAVYRFHAVVANSFRVGSIFLAGDAAHQMPPFNGQGMNSGLRDAENLSWKLALVHAGKACESLLETYDSERRPHAEGQVAHAADTGRLINDLKNGVDATTEDGYGGGRAFPHLEDGFVWGTSPAVGHPFPQPTIDGVRFDETLGEGFALIGVSGDLEAADPEFWDQLGARWHELAHPEIDHLRPNGETILVRPDRYVAAVTSDLKQLTDNVRELVSS